MTIEDVVSLASELKLALLPTSLVSLDWKASDHVARVTARAEHH